MQNILLTLLLIPALSFAQETGTGSSTGSGALTGTAALLRQMEEEQMRIQAEQEKWEQRDEEIRDFWPAMMNTRKEVAAYYTQFSANRTKRMEHRRDCRREMRRANRDTLYKVTQRCYRGDLTQNLEMLRKEEQFISMLPGIAEDTLNAALDAINTLSDAVFTIVGAIDAGVYTDEEGLLEAKQNLDHLYRVPKRLATLRVHINKLSTWLTQLMVRTHTIIENLSPPEEIILNLDEVISCFEEQQSVLTSVMALEDYSEASDQFRQVQSDVKLCIKQLYDTHTLNKELEQQEAENGESEE